MHSAWDYIGRRYVEIGKVRWTIEWGVYVSDAAMEEARWERQGHYEDVEAPDVD